MSSGEILEGIEEPQPERLFRCNIRTESNGLFVDLKGGGGHEPPVIAYNVGKGGWETNVNQIWTIYAVPGKNSVLIESLKSGKYLSSNGEFQKIQCEVDDWRDPSTQWYVERHNVRSLEDSTVVKLRNSKYADCYLDQAGNEGGGSAFISYKGHDGKNQEFRLWKRN